MRSTTELRQHFSAEWRAYDGGPFASRSVADADRATHVAPMPRKDKDSEERLAAALRENLKRRKAQARDLRDDKEASRPEP